MSRTTIQARRRKRYPVAIDAVAQRSDGSNAHVKLTELSDQGGRMEGSADFVVGERVRIALPRMGYVKAEVRWVEPESVGVSFVAESDF
jgi:hypothetical protein